MKALRTLGAVALLAGLDCCVWARSEDPRLGPIAAALRELQADPGGEKFAIVEDPRSRKFVQFVSEEQRLLILDLPCQALTNEEQARAFLLFRRLGVDYDKGSVLARPCSEFMGVQNPFSLNFGRNPVRVAKIALQVIDEVYQLPEGTELSVTVARF